MQALHHCKGKQGIRYPSNGQAIENMCLQRHYAFIGKNMRACACPHWMSQNSLIMKLHKYESILYTE